MLGSEMGVKHVITLPSREWAECGAGDLRGGDRLQYGFVCGSAHGGIGHPDLEQLSVPSCF